MKARRGIYLQRETVHFKRLSNHHCRKEKSSNLNRVNVGYVRIEKEKVAEYPSQVLETVLRINRRESVAINSIPHSREGRD